MKSTPRSLAARRSDCFYRYLKPGALAQLRNSKISARSHKSISVTRRFDTPQASPQISMIDRVPCFLSKIYGPQCLKRKKLMAARSVFFLNLGSSTPVSESNNNVSNNDGSLIALINNDALVAH